MSHERDPHHPSPTERYEDFDWTPPAKLKELAQDETLWGHYLQTAVHLENAGRKGYVRPVTDRGEDLPPFGSLHVITAVQPGSDPGSEDSAARIRLLNKQLENENPEFLRAVGSSIDGTYCEESFAIFGLDDDQARALGRRFGQVAIFSWRGPTWSLLACVGGHQSHRPWRWQEPSGA